MTDEDRPAADKSRPPPGDGPFWSLSRQDQRLLWVTFLGGLGAIVIAGVIAGGAIAAARWIRTSAHLTPLGYLGLAFATLFDVAIGGLFVWAVLHGWHRHPDKQDPDYAPGQTVVFWVIGLLFTPAGVVLLLAWIGMAAGIK